MTFNASEDLLRLPDAAKALAVSKPALMRLIAEGRLAVITHGGTQYVERSEIGAYWDRSREQSEKARAERADALGLDKLLTYEQAQDVLRVSRATLFRLLREGRIAKIRVGRRTYIDMDEIRDFWGRERVAAAKSRTDRARGRRPAPRPRARRASPEPEQSAA